MSETIAGRPFGSYNRGGRLQAWIWAAVFGVVFAAWLFGALAAILPLAMTSSFCANSSPSRNAESDPARRYLDIARLYGSSQRTAKHVCLRVHPRTRRDAAARLWRHLSRQPRARHSSSSPTALTSRRNPAVWRICHLRRFALLVQPNSWHSFRLPDHGLPTTSRN